MLRTRLVVLVAAGAVMAAGLVASPVAGAAAVPARASGSGWGPSITVSGPIPSPDLDTTEFPIGLSSAVTPSGRCLWSGRAA